MKWNMLSTCLFLIQPFEKSHKPWNARGVVTWSQDHWVATVILPPAPHVTLGHSPRLSLLMCKMRGWMVGASGPPDTSQICPDHCNKLLKGKKRKNKAACIFDVTGKHCGAPLSDNQFRSRSSGTQASPVIGPQTVELRASLWAAYARRRLVGEVPSPQAAQFSS